jgi:anti-anti-sigma regulatory factor
MSDDAIEAIVPAPTLDTRAAADLRAALSSCASAGIRLDGQSVEFIGAAALQIILSARASCVAAGAALRIVRPSNALAEQWRALGAPSDVLDPCEAAA